MTPLSFEWDKQKNQANQKKHGVSFQEAESVFYDEKAVQFWDDDHSEREDRFPGGAIICGHPTDSQ